MFLSLVGYIDTADDVEDYLSLEVPVFQGKGKLFIQVIDDRFYTIKEFRDVSSIKFVKHSDGNVVNPGDAALYLFKYNEEHFIGTKKEADLFVSNKINTHRLANYNLFSLYTFLGIREKVIETIDDILADEDDLNYSDFVIPDEVEIREDDLVLSEQAVTTYSNVFFSLTNLDYSNLTYTYDHGKEAHMWRVHLGFYKVMRNFIVRRLEMFTLSLPQNDLEYRLNDFIIGLLIVRKESLPERSKFWNYISEEIIKSEKFTDNDIVANIKDIQVRSSTNYYLLRPDEKIGVETFVFACLRIEKNINDWDGPAVHEISVAEQENNDIFKRHIIQMHVNLYAHDE